MGGVAAHPEGVGQQQRWPRVLEHVGAGHRGRREDVQHVVAIHRQGGNSVAVAQAREPPVSPLREGRAEGDAVVLDHDDQRRLESHRGHHPLVEGRGPGGAVARPGECDPVFFPEPERQRHSRAHGDERAHHADRSNDTARKVSEVDVPSAGRAVSGSEGPPEHGREMHPAFMARPDVPDHRPDHVIGFEGVAGAHRHCFLPGPQPRLGQDPGADPAFQLQVVQAVPHQALIEPEPGSFVERPDDSGTIRVVEYGRFVLAQQRRILTPFQILRGVEAGNGSHTDRLLTWKRRSSERGRPRSGFRRRPRSTSCGGRSSAPKSRGPGSRRRAETRPRRGS